MFDQLPQTSRNSSILTENDLGMLANVEHLPSDSEMKDYKKDASVKKLMDALKSDQANKITVQHIAAHALLSANNISEAWKVLML